MSGGEVMWPLGEMELAAASAREAWFEVGQADDVGGIDRINSTKAASIAIAIMIMKAVIQ
jgi:hypothetical protein